MIERFEKAKARQRQEEGSLVEILKIVTESGSGPSRRRP
jgi:hypothetical protein